MIGAITPATSDLDHMNNVLSLALPFFGLILLGYAAAKSFKQPAGGQDWLTIFVVYFTVPALLFTLLSKAPIEELGNGTFILATTGSAALVFFISLIAFRIIYANNLAQSGMRAAASAYANVGYMGVPLAVGAFGTKATIPATLIVCFDSVFFFIMAPILVALGSPGPLKFTGLVGDISRRIFLNPLIIGSAAGVLAAYFKYVPPGPVARILDYLSAAAAPCALFALGVTVAARPLKSMPRGTGLMVFTKLFVHPLAVLGAVLSLGITGIWMNTALLLATLPTALGVYVIANQYGIETHSVSNAILLSTLLSVLTVTSLLYAIELNWLTP